MWGSVYCVDLLATNHARGHTHAYTVIHSRYALERCTMTNTHVRHARNPPRTSTARLLDFWFESFRCLFTHPASRGLATLERLLGQRISRPGGRKSFCAAVATMASRASTTPACQAAPQAPSLRRAPPVGVGSPRRWSWISRAARASPSLASPSPSVSRARPSDARPSECAAPPSPCHPRPHRPSCPP